MKNQDADGLSRYSYERVKAPDDFESVKMENKTVRAICNMIVTPYMETLPVYMNILETIEDLGKSLAQKELREIRGAQREDLLI
ncbi:hypothetical protein DPMN_095263 [Dreissena polymorpha]|uniref:Uncharacterized protein n=1 Tax=Dreissena polymorpha TaxID=45954 RepID=A0A9D4L941_DREPO|nr:hypothetical protein DPMN_095263 [Dreissena polymorpha]